MKIVFISTFYNLQIDVFGTYLAYMHIQQFFVDFERSLMKWRVCSAVWLQQGPKARSSVSIAWLHTQAYDWLSIIIHVGQVFDGKQFSPGKGSKGLDCSLARVQRFTTQPEGHVPVAWVPVLISRQILLFPVTSELMIWGGKSQTRTNFLDLQDVGVVDTCSPTHLPDRGHPERSRCQPGKAAANQII